MTHPVTVHHGDSRVLLRGMDADSFDSCVCDPPYALASIVKRFGKDGSAAAVGNGAFMRASSGFMGEKWDTGDTAFDPDFWREVYRVLKPGAHLISFGGTRTYHRMACAIEDAAFEIRDQIGWLFGSGFPKSHDAGNGWGTALKPAWEPICFARKPLIGTVAANVLAHGTGAINVDACRVETEEDRRRPSAGGDNGLSGTGTFKIRERRVEDQPLTPGRWPANVIHDGSDEVIAAFPDTGISSGGGMKNFRDGGAVFQGETKANITEACGFGDSGSAARFFYTAKADGDDRLGSKHPTVKPVDLMQYLVRLVTPKGGLVLDPFAGTGTTGEAAFREGCRAVLIEREERFVADIHRRVGLLVSGAGERKRESAKAKHAGKPVDHGPLFGEPV